MIDLSESWAASFAPPDRRPIEEWAAAEVTMPTVITKRDPVTGRFTCAGSRHFIAPLRALQNGRVRGVRILAPVRGGKSLIADLYTCWAMANDNASVLSIFQDDKIAAAHAETRTMQMLKSVGAIMGLLSADRHKTRKTNFLLSDGRPFAMQGPALGGLQSRGFQVINGDECYRYEPGTIAEMYGRIGDALKADRSKALFISQGGEEKSDWDLEYQSGEEYVWHVPCLNPECSKWIAPEWTAKVEGDPKAKAGMVYDKVLGKNGQLDTERTARTARFVCHHCGHVHKSSSATWAEWDRRGQYMKPKTGEVFDYDNPPPEVSFRWTAIIDFPWHELVKLWLKAQAAKKVGNYIPLVTFFQKRMALMRSETSLHDVELPFARKKMGPASADALPDELFRFMTFDRQESEEFWVKARVWFSGGRSQRLYVGRLYSFEDIEAKRIELGIPADCVFGDSGYRPKGDSGVYAACIKYGWIAGKGVGGVSGFWHSVPPRYKGDAPQKVWKPWAPESYGDPGSGTAEEGQRQCPLVRFSSDQMAATVLQLIEAGLWEEPADVDPEDEMEIALRQQMAAEYFTWVKEPGSERRVRKLVCPSGNNHLFDCAKEQVLCAMMTGILPLDFELTTTAAERGEVAAEEPVAAG